MAWPNDDLARRTGVAKKLAREAFWKDCYKIALANPHHVDVDHVLASMIADASLKLFDEKFGDTPL